MSGSSSSAHLVSVNRIARFVRTVNNRGKGATLKQIGQNLLKSTPHASTSVQQLEKQQEEDEMSIRVRHALYLALRQGVITHHGGCYYYNHGRSDASAAEGSATSSVRSESSSATSSSSAVTSVGKRSRRVGPSCCVHKCLEHSLKRLRDYKISPRTMKVVRAGRRSKRTRNEKKRVSGARRCCKRYKKCRSCGRVITDVEPVTDSNNPAAAKKQPNDERERKSTRRPKAKKKNDKERRKKGPAANKKQSDGGEPRERNASPPPPYLDPDAEAGIGGLERKESNHSNPPVNEGDGEDHDDPKNNDNVTELKNSR